MKKKSYTINVDIEVQSTHREEASLELQKALRDITDNLPISNFWIGDITEIPEQNSRRN